MVCPSWLSFILYNPLRKFFTDREQILEETGVSNESAVLEAGAGNGFLTEMLAGKARKVYAVELQKAMVRKLRRRIMPFQSKVVIINSDIASLPPLDERFDICLLYYSFHEFSKKENAVEKIAAVMQEHGIVALYEPKLEVSAKSMRNSVDMFLRSGFVETGRRESFFTRFVKLEKCPPRATPK